MFPSSTFAAFAARRTGGSKTGGAASAAAEAIAAANAATAKTVAEARANVTSRDIGYDMRTPRGRKGPRHGGSGINTRERCHVNSHVSSSSLTVRVVDW